MKMNTYLNYGGNCEEALKFYEKHLDGKIASLMTWSQIPDAEKKHMPPGYEKAVLHACIAIGETVLMASDVPPERFKPMRSAYLSLSVSSSEEAERVYAALEDGGQVLMKMEETFFAFRFGQLCDKFGANWMVIHERPMPRSA